MPAAEPVIGDWRARWDPAAAYLAYLAPDPAAPFAALTPALLARWPEHPPYSGRVDTVVPHLTICDGAPTTVLDAAEAAVLPLLPVPAPAAEALLLDSPSPVGRGP